VTGGMLAALAVVCLAAVAAIGTYVATRKRTRLDVECLALRGRGTPLAVVFTRSGYAPALTVICVVMFGLSLMMRISATFVLVLAATQLLTQLFVDRIKAVFRRSRPDDWLFHQELGFSFPSGHSTTAVLFFGGVIVFVWMLPIALAAQIVLTAAVAIWIVGIPWSRMVLCAHYATDVLAGMLFGVASLSTMVLVIGHLPSLNFFH
jgi:membrane-associated phospholipid phosphatase